MFAVLRPFGAWDRVGGYHAFLVIVVTADGICPPIQTRDGYSNCK